MGGGGDARLAIATIKVPNKHYHREYRLPDLLSVAVTGLLHFIKRLEQDFLTLGVIYWYLPCRGERVRGGTVLAWGGGGGDLREAGHGFSELRD